MKKTFTLFSILYVLVLINQVQATTFVVQNLNDSGTNSLRAAITSANADATATSSSPHIISFDILGGGTISLLSALPDLNNFIVINGQAERITVSGGTGIRGFSVANGSEITINNLDIRNGKLSSDVGAGVLNDGTLTIDNCTIAGNNVSGTGQGAGIYNSSLGTLTVTNSTISGNTSGNYGGGICSYADLEVVNCTIADNNAGGGAGIASYGGMIAINVTVVNNSGGGIYYGGAADQGAFENVLAVGSVTGDDLYSTSSVDVIGNHNIFGTVTLITFTGVSNTTGATKAAVFGTNILGDNGGTTQTVALISGSPAIDAGTSGGSTGAPTLDQIGQSRSGATDIGAFEFQPVPTSTISRLSEDLVKVYSNPGNGFFEVEIGEGIQGTYDLKVLDNKGRQVLGSATYNKGNDAQLQSVNLTNQAQGTYLLLITTEKGIINKSLIKF
ncbi:MAG: hypothetical protein JWO58_1484 [Chitinophagaceae bacterium]|nr:hypothetical protein [Chitinophagaceae bacterium]